MSRLPRVALLHYRAPPTIGGVESTIAAHARLLAERGYAVKIIAGRGEPFDLRIPVEIIPVADSAHTNVLLVNRELASGTISETFHKLVEETHHALTQSLADVDVCIAHNVPTLHKNLALTTALHTIAQSGRVRIIAWCHDFAWDDPIYEKEMHAGAPWDLLRTPWPNTKYVAVSSARQHELAHLLDLDTSDITVIPPGIDTLEFLHVGETTARWAHELNLLEAAPLLLLPARVTRRKNIELAIEITAALRAQGHTPKLLVMGPLGPHNPTNRAYLEFLQQKKHALDLDDAVIFLQARGEVDDVIRRDLYWLADVLLFTSQREGFGIPLLEAGLARLPIFCADIPPFHESAGDAANYFALDAFPYDIATQLTQFLQNDTRYQWKQRVRQEYAWSNIFSAKIEPLMKEKATNE